MWILLAALVLLPLARFGLWWLRASARTKNVAHYQLVPTGSPSIDIEGARPFGASLTNQLLGDNKASLVLHRWSAGGVTHTALSVIGARTPAYFADLVARTLGATHTRIETVPLPEVAHLVSVRRTRRGGRVAVGEDLGGYAKKVTDELDAAGDAFVSVALEPMSPSEVRRLKAWLGKQLGAGENAATHPQMSSGELVKARVVAGAGGPERAAALGTAALPYLPGFDQGVKAVAVTDAPATIAGGLLAAAGLVSAFTGGSLLVAIPTAVGGLAVAAVLSVGPVRVRRGLTERFLAHGVVPTAAAGVLRTYGVIAKSRALLRQVAAKKVSALAGPAAPTHPLNPQLIALAPQQTAALLAMPPTSATSVTETSTTKVPAPVPATTQSGVRLGWDVTSKGVFLSDKDREAGVFVVGEIGSGKTRELLYLFGGDLMARKYGQGVGAPPLRDGQMSMLWLETKGEGTPRVLAQAERAGYTADEVLCFDAGSVTGPRLELFDRSRPVASARAFVDALTASLKPGAIEGNSKDALRQALTLALAAPDSVIAEALKRGYIISDSPIELAYALLGGRPTYNAQAGLFGLLRNAAALEAAGAPAAPTAAGVSTAAAEPAPVEEDADPFAALFGNLDETSPVAAAVPAAATEVAAPAAPAATASVLAGAVDDFSYFMAKPERERRLLFNAPYNKVSDLRGVPGLWARDGRPSYTLGQLLREHLVAILDFSVAQVVSHDDGADDLADGEDSEDLSRILGALTLNLFRNAVKGNCSGWQHAGRSVSFYTDELEEIAGKDASGGGQVVRWLFDKGRSFGVQMNVATQRPHQLPDDVAQAARSAGTLVYLRLSAPEVAQAAFNDVVSTSDSPFALEDLRNLPNQEAICRTRIDGTPQRTPFSLLVPDDDEFDADTYYQSARPFRGEQMSGVTL